MEKRDTSPSQQTIRYLEEKISEVKAKLTEHGVPENQYRAYWLGVLACNLGTEIPPSAPLPERQVAVEEFDQQLVKYNEAVDKSMAKCTATCLQLSCVNSMTPLIPSACKQAKVLKEHLDVSVELAAQEKFQAVYYRLHMTPVNKKAFYAKVTPLFNELEHLAKQYEDAKRAMVDSYLL